MLLIIYCIPHCWEEDTALPLDQVKYSPEIINPGAEGRSANLQLFLGTPQNFILFFEGGRTVCHMTCPAIYKLNLPLLDVTQAIVSSLTHPQWHVCPKAFGCLKLWTRSFPFLHIVQMLTELPLDASNRKDSPYGIHSSVLLHRGSGQPRDGPCSPCPQ